MCTGKLRCGLLCIDEREGMLVKFFNGILKFFKLWCGCCCLVVVVGLVVVVVMVVFGIGLINIVGVQVLVTLLVIVFGVGVILVQCVVLWYMLVNTVQLV